MLVIVAFFLVADLFFHSGRPITFDGQIHITTMAQFASALKDGEFPVRWANNFANYGLPLGLFAHQTTNYLGAVFILLTHQVVFSYNLVLLLGAILSSLFCYFFLRFYFSAEAALAASFLFNFAPYRIVNIYIRGALPEFWASVFVWLVMIGLYKLFHDHKWHGWILFSLGLTLLLLTHPMMFLITSVIFGPYALFLQLPYFQTWWDKKSRKALQILIKNFLLLVGAVITAFLMASYYILPLTLEIKYFYHGLDQRHFASSNYLSLANYLGLEKWSYFSKTEVGPRGLVFHIGTIEITVILIGSLVALSYILLRRHKLKKPPAHLSLLYFGLLLLALSSFFTLPQSDFFYQHFLPLNNIQFPWRFLSAVLCIPPLIAAWLLERLPHRSFFVFIFMLLIAAVRFPQLYGKNFFSYAEDQYFSTPYNLHSNNLNTIWSGVTEEYPRKQEQFAIIEGSGKITQAQIKNSWRKYELENPQTVRMVDYTFYFPGWMVLIDGHPTTIQFQDPNYRGIITYQVPAGKHQVTVEYQNTKIRTLAQVISGIGIVIWLTLSFGFSSFLLPLRKWFVLS